MILSWIVGIVMIAGGISFALLALFAAGISFALLALFAAGMADRETTWWERVGTPLLCLLPVLLGIAIIVWR